MLADTTLERTPAISQFGRAVASVGALNPEDRTDDLVVGARHDSVVHPGTGSACFLFMASMPAPKPPAMPPYSPPPLLSASGVSEGSGYTIVFTIVASGTVASFNSTAYRHALARTAGVRADDVSVQVTAASVRVSARILTRDTGDRDHVLAILTPLGSDAALASLQLAVQVEAVEPIVVEFGYGLPPSLPRWNASAAYSSSSAGRRE